MTLTVDGFVVAVVAGAFVAAAALKYAYALCVTRLNKEAPK